MEKAIADRIRTAVEAKRGELIDFLCNLIKIPSINGQEGEAQAFVARRLKDIGLEVDVFEPNVEDLKKHPAFEMSRKMAEWNLGFDGRPDVVGVYRGKGGGRSLILNGHIDVMPPGPLELWDFEPFGGEVKDGLVLGRGAADMKNGIAAQTMALAALLHAGIKLKGDVYLESVVDEESSSNGTLACLLRGYRADAGICTEGTSNMIAPAQAGGIVFSIRVYGSSASVLRTQAGVSAVDQVAKICQGLANLSRFRVQKAHHDIIDPRSLGIYAGMVEAGTWQNMFPMVARIDGVMRLLPNEDTNQVKRELVDYIAKLAALDPSMSAHPPKVTFFQTWHPAEIPKDHGIVTTLQHAYVSAFGYEGKVGPREGGTDAWVLTKYGSTPTVAYGPGSPAKMHVVNESVEVEALVETTHVLAQAIAEWCGMAA